MTFGGEQQHLLARGQHKYLQLVDTLLPTIGTVPVVRAVKLEQAWHSILELQDQPLTHCTHDVDRTGNGLQPTVEQITWSFVRYRHAVLRLGLNLIVIHDVLHLFFDPRVLTVFNDRLVLSDLEHPLDPLTRLLQEVRIRDVEQLSYP